MQLARQNHIHTLSTTTTTTAVARSAWTGHVLPALPRLLPPAAHPGGAPHRGNVRVVPRRLPRCVRPCTTRLQRRPSNAGLLFGLLYVTHWHENQPTNERTGRGGPRPRSLRHPRALPPRPHARGGENARTWTKDGWLAPCHSGLFPFAHKHMNTPPPLHAVCTYECNAGVAGLGRGPAGREHGVPGRVGQPPARRGHVDGCARVRCLPPVVQVRRGLGGRWARE